MQQYRLLESYQSAKHTPKRRRHLIVARLPGNAFVIAPVFSEKVGGQARAETPEATVTALRMRFPKDRTFVFDVEYSYRVDGVFTDFIQVRLLDDVY